MTPYQRGHRDSLLNLAVLLDAEANKRRQQVAKYGDAKRGTVRYTACLMESATEAAYRHAANMARRQAEMMPDDPEVGDE